jgi:THO complex subunit 5
MAPISAFSAQTTLHPPTLTDPSILRVRDNVHQIKLLTSRIVHLRSQPHASEDDEIQQQITIDQKKLANLKIMLRGFNREMYLENRGVKTATSEAKSQVDDLYLNLQNLKYEQQHLRSEIQDCRNYQYCLV